MRNSSNLFKEANTRTKKSTSKYEKETLLNSLSPGSSICHPMEST